MATDRIGNWGAVLRAGDAASPCIGAPIASSGRERRRMLTTESGRTKAA
jgi:hypothetical protein